MTKCLFANFWFMLAYSNSVEMSCEKNFVFAIYDRARTLKHDEMFACNWRKFLIHTCILRFCQDVLSKNVIFRNLWSCSHAKIWRNALIARNWRMFRNLIFFVFMFQFERDVLTIDLYFAFDLLHYMREYT